MPQDKDFKRLVRDRMSNTGERYTTARSELEAARIEHPLTPEIRVMLSMLGITEQAEHAYKQLEQLPTETRRRAALEGLRHTDWQVRSRSAQLLDNLTLTVETQQLLTELLEDEHPRVRYEVFHTLTCEHCKPEVCDVDIRGIAGKMVDDPVPRLRRAASGALSYYFDDEAIEKLRTLKESDPNGRVRRETHWKLANAEGRRRGHEAFLALPSHLQERLKGRYSGKWVGISDGKVLSAHVNLKRVRSEVRGLGRTDSGVLCFVAPKPPGA